MLNKNTKAISAAKRFFYWLAPEEFLAVRASLKARRERLTPIKGVPCKGMNALAPLASVAPETWDQVCRRQGSWYRASRRNGQYLIISAKPLAEIAGRLSGVIVPCDFQPSKWASAKMVAALIGSPEYRKAEPLGWRRVEPREEAYWRNLLDRIGERAALRDLLDAHSANHANFIEPALFVKEGAGERVAPYSIARTGQVCSACLELFNILGEQFERKYVMPCPGYVLYAGHPKDRYLVVLSGELAREEAKTGLLFARKRPANRRRTSGTSNIEQGTLNPAQPRRYRA